MIRCYHLNANANQEEADSDRNNGDRLVLGRDGRFGIATEF